MDCTIIMVLPSLSWARRNGKMVETADKISDVEAIKVDTTTDYMEDGDNHNSSRLGKYMHLGFIFWLWTSLLYHT